MLDVNVLKYLYKESVKNFIRENQIDFNLEVSDTRLVELFNNIDNTENKQRFLVNELLYGMQRNVYISKINENGHNLTDINNIIQHINNLTEYTNDLELLNEEFISDNIGRNIDIDEKKLLYYNINMDENKINIILAAGIREGEIEDLEELCVYYSITIDLENLLLIIRMRNMESEYKYYKVDSHYEDIKMYISNRMEIELTRNDDNYYRSTLYNIVDYVNNTVLTNFYNEIGTLIQPNIEEFVNGCNTLLNEYELTNEDNNVIIENIRNSYCKLMSQNRLQNLDSYEIKNIYNVNGYANRVTFEDDSIGNTRVKSGTVKDSLLNTTTFYDIKASMERGRNIKEANIQWLDENNKRINTVFNNERQGKFKVVIKNNYFDERIDNYVLQKIVQYSPR